MVVAEPIPTVPTEDSMGKQNILVLIFVPLMLSLLVMTPELLSGGLPGNDPRLSSTWASALTIDNDAVMTALHREAKTALDALQLKRSAHGYQD